jgi:peptidoglycan/xylan/chitin deacetylase (PgdA/CDA1 family)
MLETGLDLFEIEIDEGKGELVSIPNKDQRLVIADRLNARLKRLPNEIKEKRIAEISASAGVEIPSIPGEEFSSVTPSQARTMDSMNVKIESHTVTHPILTGIPEPQLEYELRRSKDRLEELLDRRINHFCYPNGDLDQKIRESVKDAGYISAVSTRYGRNECAVDLFTLNRISSEPLFENFVQGASGFESLKKRIRGGQGV